MSTQTLRPTGDVDNVFENGTTRPAERREADAFNAATAGAVPQRDAERPWSMAAISVTYAIEHLPLDVDPTELARRVPPQSAYRLDDLAAALDWLARLIAARQEIAS